MMDFEKFKKVFDESFGKVTPNQFVLKMKGLGYKFIDVPTPITTEEADKLSDTIIQALNRFGKNYNESSFGLPVLVKSYEMIQMVSLMINTYQPKHPNDLLQKFEVIIRRETGMPSEVCEEAAKECIKWLDKK